MGILGNAATTGLLYQPRMIGGGDCGEICGIKIGRGNRSTRRKSAPAPLCWHLSKRAIDTENSTLLLLQNTLALLMESIVTDSEKFHSE
jgi:hypothetical protein